MKDIATKINGDSIDASEWNPSQAECENIVTDTGQTLNALDNFQLSKAAAIYAGRGDYYNDTGSPNTCVISSISPMQQPVAYVDGLRVRFIPAHASTGASTITINGLTSKAVKKGSFIATPADLVANDLLPGYLTEAIYSATLGCFILSPSSYTQILAASQLPVGSKMFMTYPSTSPPTGWVLVNDGTIGSALSGATNRANDDCINLFVVLWNGIAAYDPVVGGKGGSALADWAANKTIKLSTAGVTRTLVNAAGNDALIGGNIGAATVALTGTNNGAHTHPYSGPAGEQIADPNPGGVHCSRWPLDNATTITQGDGTPFSIQSLSTYENLFQKL